MKRWLVVLLVLLALLVLISPGIVGRLAEKNIDETIDWAASDSPGVSIQTESFDRGWFTSAGRHRVVFDGNQFREAANYYEEATGNATLPSLIIDTALAHGPLPGGSMSPGLASLVSTFSIDPGDGTTFDLPGALTSNVSLAGESDSRLLLEAGFYQHEVANLAWQGADIKVLSNASTGAISVNGEIKPWNISADGALVSIGVMSLVTDQVESDYGFSVGTLEMQVGEIKIEDEESGVTIGGISLSADSEIADARVSAHSLLSVQKMSIPNVGEVNLSMDVSLDGLDATAASVIGKAVEEAQSANDPEAALANLYPEIESDVQTLFQRGFSVRMDKFDLSLPQGVVETKLEVSVPEAGAGAAFDWATVLLTLSAKLDMRVPGPIYDMAAMFSPQAGSLVSMGILVQDGDDYVVSGEYAQGLINVNGVPMPIPMPGL